MLPAFAFRSLFRTVFYCNTFCCHAVEAARLLCVPLLLSKHCCRNRAVSAPADFAAATVRFSIFSLHTRLAPRSDDSPANVSISTAAHKASSANRQSVTGCSDFSSHEAHFKFETISATIEPPSRGASAFLRTVLPLFIGTDCPLISFPSFFRKKSVPASAPVSGCLGGHALMFLLVCLDEGDGFIRSVRYFLLPSRP